MIDKWSNCSPCIFSFIAFSLVSFNKYAVNSPTITPITIEATKRYTNPAIEYNAFCAGVMSFAFAAEITV